MSSLLDFPEQSLLIATLSCATFTCLKLFGVAALKFAKSISDHERDEVSAKCVSTVHAVAAAFAAIAVLALDWHAGWATRANVASSRQIALVAFSCGYFAYDLLWACFDIARMGSGDQELTRKLPYFGHHLACFLVYSLCLKRQFFLLYTVFFLSWEVSTPLLNLRWLLLKFSDHENASAKRLRRVIDVSFALSFIGARNIAGTLNKQLTLVLAFPVLFHCRESPFCVCCSSTGNWMTWHLWTDLLPLLSLPTTDVVRIFSDLIMFAIYLLRSRMFFFRATFIASLIAQPFVVLMLACSFTLSSLNLFWCWQIIQSVIGGSSRRGETKHH
jgi:hypothetical protein